MRNLFRESGWLLGVWLGYVLRLISRRQTIYRRLILWNRRLSDKFALWSVDFFAGLGMALFDLREPAYLEMTLVNGPKMHLDISEKTQRQIYSHKIFEAPTSRFFLSTLEKGDTAIDVGANVGYFTLLAAAAVGEEGKVIAIEPESRNFKALESNIRLNGHKNVCAYKYALGAEPGEAVLHLHPFNRGAHSLQSFGEEYVSEGVRHSASAVKEQFKKEELYETVSVRTLDDLIESQKIKEVSVLKIDVENLEFSVLRGAEMAFKNRIVRNVVCEVNNPKTRPKLFKLMDEYGYVPYMLDFNGTPKPLRDIAKVTGGNVLFMRN